MPTSTALPEHLELLRATWHLLRLHNTDDLETTCALVADHCAAHHRGTAAVLHWEPGTEHNHWTVPERWHLDGFSLTDAQGTVIASHDDHPLAVAAYSSPVDVELTLDELLDKVVTRPDLPDAHEFRFGRMFRHWEPGWELSLPHALVSTLAPGRYRVRIGTRRTAEAMPLLEYVLPGRSTKTVYLVAHLDHPGMVNDGLSGCVALLQAMRRLEATTPETELTYRVLLVPEIIGSVMYLATRERAVDDAVHSLHVNLTGHDAPMSICTSKRGRSLLDHALRVAALELGVPHTTGPFWEHFDAGDEICFDAPGYGIPSPVVSRPGEAFDAYHTSADTLERFLEPASLARHDECVRVIARSLELLELNRELTATFRGTPCLSHPALDLYLTSSNISNVRAGDELIDLDGRHLDPRKFTELFLSALSEPGLSTVEIAYEARLPFDLVADYAARFADRGLIVSEPCVRRDAMVWVPGVSMTAAAPDA